MKCIGGRWGHLGACPQLIPNELKLGASQMARPLTVLSKHPPVLAQPRPALLLQLALVVQSPTRQWWRGFFGCFLRRSPFCTKIAMFLGYLPRVFKEFAVLPYRRVVDTYTRNKYNTLPSNCVQSVYVALICQL